MINIDYITKEDIKEYNPASPKILDHPCRILIIGSSWSEKTNALFNLMGHQPDINKKLFIC